MRAGLDAETPKDAPVTVARFDDLAVRLVQKVIAEPKGLVCAAWVGMSSRIGRDAYDCG